MALQVKIKGLKAAALAIILCVAQACTGCAYRNEQNLDKRIEKTAKVFLKDANFSQSDWAAFGLARWGGEVPKQWFADYYAGLEQKLTACDGVLHERKYTEYSKTVLALTACGKDPAAIAGYNLLLPLADFEQTVFQGVNGPVVALLALDSGNYEIPATVTDSTQATREMYVEYILDAQLPGGGWTMKGEEAEADITAMALQALVKYQHRKDVVQAVENGLAVLSALQDENGGFTAFGAQSSEAVSQVIVALTELGISLEDSRFVKGGNTLLDALLQFRQKDGRFSHLLGGKSDRVATEQAFYALVAVSRMEKGETSLYRVK